MNPRTPTDGRRSVVSSVFVDAGAGMPGPAVTSLSQGDSIDHGKLVRTEGQIASRDATSWHTLGDAEPSTRASLVDIFATEATPMGPSVAASASPATIATKPGTRTRGKRVHTGHEKADLLQQPDGSLPEDTAIFIQVLACQSWTKKVGQTEKILPTAIEANEHHQMIRPFFNMAAHSQDDGMVEHAPNTSMVKNGVPLVRKAFVIVDSGIANEYGGRIGYNSVSSGHMPLYSLAVSQNLSAPPPTSNCWQLPKGCLQSFSYKGQTLWGCTMVDNTNGTAWCSPSAIFTTGVQPVSCSYQCSDEKGKAWFRFIAVSMLLTILLAVIMGVIVYRRYKKAADEVAAVGAARSAEQRQRRRPARKPAASGQSTAEEAESDDGDAISF